MNFHIGQKVVCVKGERRFGLTEGNIYTISGGGLFAGVYLVDVAECPTTTPNAWYPSRFRPVVERKTDISIFTRMLTSAPCVKEHSP